MLIQYTVKNWLSFRDPVEFSMIASSERQHNDRLARVNKFDLRVLPTAALYGGNASGKTNFVSSLAFAQSMIVGGTQPDDAIAVQPFLLDPESVNEPCTFLFEILVDELVYQYGFSVTATSVVEERLARINSTSETVLFHRKGDRLAELHSSLKPKDFYKFAFQGTRDNQLYLTNAVSQNVTEFRPVYDWFKNTLMLVSPDSRLGQLEFYTEKNHPLHGVVNVALSLMDTGISRLGGEQIPLEALPFPDQVLNAAKKAMGAGENSRLNILHTDERFVLTRENGELKAHKLVAYHKRSDGKEVQFDLNQESSGTQRVIELLPAFEEASSRRTEKVYVIDEVDRSLHTLLTRQLLEAYLDTRDESSRSQLIFTTHDVLLMDQELLRRDEMWVAERDKDGQSNLFSLAEYKELRNDTDIRKRYLQGRLGGIPRILFAGALSSGIHEEQVKGE